MRGNLLSPLMLCGMLAGCATPSLTLLSGEDGRPGAVAVLETGGKPIEAVVDAANSRTSLNGQPRPRPIDPARLNASQRSLLGELPPAPVGLTLYFKEGTTELTADSQPGLDFLKSEIARRPGAEVQVTGYTDTVGSAEDNDALSQQRAEEVVGALALQGIDRDVMSAVGRGERELREPTEDGVGNAANRRVVVIVR